jgi:hypothetical protein
LNKEREFADVRLDELLIDKLGRRDVVHLRNTRSNLSGHEHEHRKVLSYIQELEVVVGRYIIARRRRSPYDTNIKLENYVISDR